MTIWHAILIWIPQTERDTYTMAPTTAQPATVHTGKGSVSLNLHLITVLIGALVSGFGAILAVIHPYHQASAVVYGASGIVAIVLSTIAKLYHDKSLHVAYIQHVGYEAVTHLPALEQDLADVKGYVASHKAVIDSSVVQLAGLAGQIPALHDISMSAADTLLGPGHQGGGLLDRVTALEAKASNKAQGQALLSQFEEFVAARAEVPVKSEQSPGATGEVSYTPPIAYQDPRTP